MTIFPQNNQDSGQTDLMDIQHRDYQHENRPNLMSHLALICGILSLIGIFFNLSLPIGALSVIFALLSRDRKLCREAKHGLIMGLVGIAVTVVAVISSIAILVSSGLFGKYYNRIRNIDTSDPSAITEIQNDLIKDLQKYYGLDSSSSSETGADGNSPIDPVIGGSRKERQEANRKARENQEADSISEASGTESSESSPESGTASTESGQSQSRRDSSAGTGNGAGNNGSSGENNGGNAGQNQEDAQGWI